MKKSQLEWQNPLRNRRKPRDTRSWGKLRGKVQKSRNSAKNTGRTVSNLQSGICTRWTAEQVPECKQTLAAESKKPAWWLSSALTKRHVTSRISRAGVERGGVGRREFCRSFRDVAQRSGRASAAEGGSSFIYTVPTPGNSVLFFTASSCV